MVKFARERFKLFDCFIPFDVLGKIYDEQLALLEIELSIGFFGRSVNESSLIITHQPKYQKVDRLLGCSQGRVA